MGTPAASQSKRICTAADLLGLAAVSIFFLHFLPWDVLRRTPASGGDMGSHFWPLYTLVQHGLPQLQFPVWNPGNNGGEPQLVHYFPLPFLIMAALGAVLPLGTAFNVGTLLPLLALPLCAYLCARRLRAPCPAPLLAAALLLPALYNERFSMWGGNTLSALAGQFAHLYALCFLLLALGSLARELSRGAWPFWSALWFAATLQSHAYIALGIPLFLLSFLIAGVGAADLSLLGRVRRIALSFVLALLLSAWFIVPMVTNQPWTTPMPMTWARPEVAAGVLSPILLLPAIVALLGALLLLFKARRRLLQIVLFFALPICGYIVFYFIFPALGLVDVRALPQVLLFACACAGVLIGSALSFLPRGRRLLSALLIVCVVIVWCRHHVSLFPRWLEWNYSGWTAKPAYSDLTRLYSTLQGGFSQPRVIYEHSPRNEAAGSLRVFEMLPYFTGRATLESLYSQSTILAPAAYLLQSEVSRFPSCPLRDYPCAPQDICGAVPRLQLLAVGQLIAVEPETVRQAEQCTALQAQGAFGAWHLFALQQQPSLAFVLAHPPQVIAKDGWKARFYEWLRSFDGTQPFLALETTLDRKTARAVQAPSTDPLWQSSAECEPSLDVSFSGLTLHTDCPGSVHILKFAYHPTWKTSTGDIPFLVSPGFIALIPSAPQVDLRFAQSPTWTLSRLLSALTLTLLLFPKLFRTRSLS